MVIGSSDYIFFQKKLLIYKITKPFFAKEVKTASIFLLTPYMTKKTTNHQKLEKIYRALSKAYGPQTCPLLHKNPLQLLIATILSAQCTDVRVNQVTPALFSRYQDVKAFTLAEPEELALIIKSAGLYKNKTKSIIGCCKKLVEDYSGKVPKTMEELTNLPGIGRKTANVILGNAFAIPGFPVDTHVKRLLNRIGLVSVTDPVKIEFAITNILPDKYWTEFSHLLITHGRNRCRARKPDCAHCEIRRWCDYPK